MVLGDKQLNGENIQDSENKVKGWVLTCQSDDLFQEKLETYDRIEGYQPDGSGLYHRSVVNIKLDHFKDYIGKIQGQEGTIVKAYAYHRQNCDKNEIIESGDWMQRVRS